MKITKDNRSHTTDLLSDRLPGPGPDTQHEGNSKGEGVSTARQILGQGLDRDQFPDTGRCLIFKYGRKPLTNFPERQQSAERSERLEQSMELKKKPPRTEYEEAVARLEKMQETIKEVETYMMEDAERQRQVHHATGRGNVHGRSSPTPRIWP